MNWQFEDVSQFLKQHGFEYLNTIKAGGTSHKTFIGFIDGEERLVDVPFHAGDSITPKNLQHTIIPHSGIPEKCWIKYTELSKPLRKKYQYKGKGDMSKKLFKKLIKRASQPKPKEQAQQAKSDSYNGKQTRRRKTEDTSD